MFTIKQFDIKQKGENMENNFPALKIRCISNLIRRTLDNNLNTEFDDITNINSWIIRYIDKNSNKNIYQKDLEKEFSITRSTASKVVNLMEKKGYIKRESVEGDARLKKLTLTDKAKDVTYIMKRNVSNIEKKMVKGISKEDLEVFCNVIDKMERNILE